jgi:DNA-binding response OmpR family regulator
MGLFDLLRKSKTADQPATPPRCILVVSDDAQTSDTLCRYLSEGGFDVYCASSIAEARQVIDASTHIDLMIGDFTNPEIDGKAFMQMARIRMGHKAFPQVVFLMDTESDEIVATCMGVSEVLRKPVDQTTLIQCVEARALIPQ